MLQNDEPHIHSLDFEASFNELSILEGRYDLGPQTDLRKEYSFSLQGENSRVTFLGIGLSYTPRGSALPRFPQGNISIDV